MTRTTSRTTVDDTVVFERLPGGVLRIVLTDEARERLLSDRAEVRDRVRAAMLANAGEIAARRRWATIYRGGRPPAAHRLRATA